MLRRRVLPVVLAVTAGVAALGASAASAQVNCGGVPGFQSCTAYPTGASVVFQGKKYRSIAPISAGRDCPPNSPYNPGNDNWWSEQGTCTTGSPTATATYTPTPTATRTHTPTATRTATPRVSPTTPPGWKPNAAYAVDAVVAFDTGKYKALQAHTSDAGHVPPNMPALWQNLSTPPPACTPKINVNVSVTALSVGQSITVTASGNVGNGSWGISAYDVSTGLVQSPSDPIVDPPGPQTLNTPATTVSWTYTGVRSGSVAFYVSVQGEGPIPGMCGGFAFTNVFAISTNVTVGGPPSTRPLVIARNGFIGCDGKVSTPIKLEWSHIPSAGFYSIGLGNSASGPFTPWASGVVRPSFQQWSQAWGYYQISAHTSQGVIDSVAKLGTFAIPSCPTPSPVPRPRPTP